MLLNYIFRKYKGLGVSGKVSDIQILTSHTNIGRLCGSDCPLRAAPKRVFCMLRQRIDGTADGARRSTGDTHYMGASAGTGEALAWAIARDVPSNSPGHGVAHRGRKVSPHSRTQPHLVKMNDPVNVPLILSRCERVLVDYIIEYVMRGLRCGGSIERNGILRY